MGRPMCRAVESNADEIAPSDFAPNVSTVGLLGAVYVVKSNLKSEA